MANSTDSKVLYFDSTSGAAVTGTQHIMAVVWVSDQTSNKDIAAEDDFLLSQTNGDRIIGKRASSSGDDLGLCPCKPLIVDGITLTAMDGGVCYIWLA